MPTATLARPRTLPKVRHDAPPPATPKLSDGGSDFPPLYDDAGNRRAVCDWQDDACPSAPTHHIAFIYCSGNHDGTDAAPCEQFVSDEDNRFCARHYALALARWAKGHSGSCATPLAGHIHHFGPIAEYDPPESDGRQLP